MEFVWTFNEGVYTAQAKYVSDQDPTDIQLFDAQMSYTVIEEPKCEIAGKGLYTATYADKTDTREVELAPIGHDYVFDSFVWGDDYSAQAKFVCTRDADVKLYTAEVEKETVRTATRFEKGLIRYTASYGIHSEVKEVETDIISSFEFELNADGKSYAVKSFNMEGMEEMIIPEEYEGLPVTSILDNAMTGDNTTLKRVEIPATITSIGTYFCCYLPNLHYIYLPKTVEAIGINSVTSNSRITVVTDASSKPSQWRIGTSVAYFNCVEGENLFAQDGVIYLKEEASLSAIAYDSFAAKGNENAPLYLGGEHKVDIDGEQTTLTNVNAYAFIDVARPIAVLDASLTVADNAFYKCPAMTLVALGSVSTSITDDSTQLVTLDIEGAVIAEENGWYGAYGNDKAYLFHYVGDALDVKIPTAFFEKDVDLLAGHAFAGKTLRSIYRPASISNVMKNAVMVDYCALLLEATTNSNWDGGRNNRTYYGVLPEYIVDVGNATYVIHYQSYYKTYRGLMLSYNDLESSVALVERSVTVGETTVNVEAIACNAFINTSVTFLYIPNTVSTITDKLGLASNGTLAIFAQNSSKPDGWRASEIYTAAIYYKQTLDDMNGLFIKDGLLFATLDDGSEKTLRVLGYQEDPGTSLVIPETVETDEGTLRVTEIGDRAFYRLKTLETVSLPSIVKVGKYAFSESGIASVTFGDSLVEIDQYAFYDCDNLLSVSIPCGEKFGSYCFGASTNLSTVTFADEVSGSLGAYMFSYCSALVDLRLSPNISSIGKRAFESCTSLETVKIPSGIKEIGANCFSGCNKIKRVDIPSTVTFVGDSAFSGVAASATIFIEATNIASWNSYWKDKCSANVILGLLPEGQATIDGIRYYYGGGRAMIYGSESTLEGEVTIPSAIQVGDDEYKVVGILGSSFFGRSGITALNLPDTLESIGDNAFEGCTALKELVIPDNCLSLGANFINQTALSFISVPAMDKVFDEYFSSGTVPSVFEVRGGEIPARAFYRSSPTRVQLCEGVTAIGEWAFADSSSYSNKTRLIVPASVEKIGSNAFNSSTLIVYLRANEAGEQWVSSWNSGATYYLGFNPDANEYVTAGFHFYIKGEEAYLAYYDGDATQVDVPEIVNGHAVTKILRHAFNKCKGIETLVIPTSVTSIAQGCLNGCTSLSTLKVPFLGGSSLNPSYLRYFFINGSLDYVSATSVPESLLTLRIDGGSIIDKAFEKCGKLQHLIIGDNVTFIGTDVFLGCDSLEYNIDMDKEGLDHNEVRYLGSETNPYRALVGIDYIGKTNVVVHEGCAFICAGAFASESKVHVVHLPDTVLSIGEKAFYKSGLLDINFPDSLEDIGSYAFAETSIPAAKFSKDSKLTTIDDYAFYRCTALSYLTLPEGFKWIGDSAFRESSLSHVILPSTCQYVGEYGFGDILNSSIVYAYIHGSTRLAANAFKGMGEARILTDAESYSDKWTKGAITGGRMYYGVSRDQICVSGNVIYVVDGAKNTGIAIAPSPALTEEAAYSVDLLIPAMIIEGERPAFEVTEIAPYAFYGTLELKGIDLSQSMVTSVGEYAFFNCVNVMSAKLSDKIAYAGPHAFYALHDNAYTSVGGVLYLGSESNPYIICIGAGRSFGSGAVAICEGCKVIDRNAFYQRDITSITLPDGVVCIWESAFALNDTLNGQTVYIPASVLYMGPTIFRQLRNMTLTINCAAASKPEGWDDAWNYKQNPIISSQTHTTHWGVAA